MVNQIILFFLFISFISKSQINCEILICDEQKNGIPYAIIEVDSLKLMTNENGRVDFEFDSTKSHIIQIKNVGFSSLDTSVFVNKCSQQMNFILKQIKVNSLNEFVLIEEKPLIQISKSTIKKVVFAGDFFNKNISPTNLMKTMSMINGLQEVVSCGVCYTNSISINGLEGKYTSIMIDGSPMYGSLASVYGLNGIPMEIIDKIEVIKGPNTILYGAEGIAGVINIITKNIEQQPKLSFHQRISSHGEMNTSVSSLFKSKLVKGIVSLDYALSNRFHDVNKDFFNDIINQDRVSFFSKNILERKSKKIFETSFKLYYEDRRNGVEEYLKSNKYRGSKDIYGESIITKRAEIFGKYEFNTNEKVWLNYSLSSHFQDSYYGSTSYLGEQHLFFLNLIWNKQIAKHNIHAGISLRGENYDDNTLATQLINSDGVILNNPIYTIIPGLFVQDDFAVTDKLSLLLGGRVDHNGNHGFIFTPSLNAEYNPSKWTTFRLNSSTGFKVVNLFTEDHAFITGQRQVLLNQNLKPEQSINSVLNMTHIYGIGKSSGTIDIDVFFNYFFNQINPDYSSNQFIIYDNSKGNHIYKGVNTSLSHQFKRGFSFSLGASILNSYQKEPNGLKSDVLFAPEYSGNMSVNYKLIKYNLLLAISGSYTGSMTLPEVYDLDNDGELLLHSRPVQSTPFSILNLQITKYFKKSVECYFGIENILDFMQKESPLAGYNDPNHSIGFSPYFDTSYAYASTHGRDFYIGIRVKFGK